MKSLPPKEVLDMHLKRNIGFTLAIVVVVAIALGCAKRPATTAAAAPPPTAGPVGAAPGGAGAAPGSAAVPTPAAPAPPTATPAPPHPREFAAIRELEDIHFDFDKYDIRPGDAKILDVNAQWMKANAGHLILIEGHADERGTNEYNLALGERRAKTTMNYLVARGIRANRITIISYGEERPLCTEKTEECWARNRRAHFLVKAQ